MVDENPFTDGYFALVPVFECQNLVVGPSTERKASLLALQMHEVRWVAPINPSQGQRTHSRNMVNRGRCGLWKGKSLLVVASCGW